MNTTQKKFNDPQGWDSYWEKKRRHVTKGYDAIAYAYRHLVIKRRLDAVIAEEFPKGAKLLHAGCGSGGVDKSLHRDFKISAVDISPEALAIYKGNNPTADDVRQADIFDLPFEAGTFDGVYNLGVVEHFEGDQLKKIFDQFHRVLKPGGKFVAFWPHAYATSVVVLGAAHFVLNDVLHKNVRLHPAEVSLLKNRAQAETLLASGGFRLKSYEFGARDLFVQAVVVAERI